MQFLQIKTILQSSFYKSSFLSEETTSSKIEHHSYHIKVINEREIYRLPSLSWLAPYLHILTLNINTIYMKIIIILFKVVNSVVLAKLLRLIRTCNGVFTFSRWNYFGLSQRHLQIRSADVYIFDSMHMTSWL